MNLLEDENERLKYQIHCKNDVIQKYKEKDIVETKSQIIQTDLNEIDHLKSTLKSSENKIIDLENQITKLKTRNNNSEDHDALNCLSIMYKENIKIREYKWNLDENLKLVKLQFKYVHNENCKLNNELKRVEGENNILQKDIVRLKENILHYQTSFSKQINNESHLSNQFDQLFDTISVFKDRIDDIAVVKLNQQETEENNIEVNLFKDF